MRQRQRPQAQVGRRVGDAPQHKLHSVDGLLHQHLAEHKLLLLHLLGSTLSHWLRRIDRELVTGMRPDSTVALEQ